MSFKAAIDYLAARCEELNPVTEADYKQNGVLMCGVCHKPKQTPVEIFGVVRMMPIACDCVRARAAAIEEEERRKRTDNLRRECFASSKLWDWTFSRDDGKDSKMSKAARAYVETFDKMLSEGKGLLLYGPTGRGKSFLAGCIANALMDEERSCLMTNFKSIEEASRIRFGGGEQSKLDLSKFKLLCLDDLGAERDTSYMQEIVFSVIDERYQANLPMVITTNLTLDEFKKPKSITEERIFKRVLERCFPIEATGPDRRVLRIREDYDGMKSLLGL